MKNAEKKSKFIPSLNLRGSDTVSDAFNAIDGRFGVIVTVVGEGKRLRGIVSEGDLRRAIMTGKPVDTPLECVMNTEPVTLKVGELSNRLKCNKIVDRIEQCYGSGQGQQATIPVVDKDHAVIGLIIPEMLYDVKGFNEIVNNGKKSGNPQVLIIGGAGYIGSVLVRMLLAGGWRVKVLDNMLYRQRSLNGIDDKRLSVIYGDITTINDMVETIEGVDAVVYLAEIVGDAACAYNPDRALKTNYLSVINMAHLSAYLHISRFIYASSCSVYGGSRNPGKQLSEISELNPVSYYGRMKMMAEQALLGIQNPLFRPTILRLATVFGYSYRPRFDLVVNSFAKDAFFNKSIKVFGGSQWRPNVHVSDVAGAIAAVLNAPIDSVARQIFNIGNSRENHTIDDLAKLTRRVFPDVKIKTNEKSADARNYRVDFGKVEKVLGYRAKVSVLEGMEELKDVFKAGKIKNPEDPSYSNIKAIKEVVERRPAKIKGRKK